LITPIPSNKKNDAKRDTRRPYRDEEQNNDDSYWEEQPEDTFHCLEKSISMVITDISP
jgi:hypothetical protein